MDYDRGLRPLGPTTYAYLQPDGGWGWSNAGLVTGPDGAILIDTFFDLPRTRELLEAVRGVTDRPFRALVNTHHNGDHCWGNQLVDAVVVAHRNCRDEMVAGASPDFLAGVLDAPDTGGATGYLKRAFGDFDFSGIHVSPPEIVFDTELSLYLGEQEVRLLYFGPAHTLGDIAVWVPSERVLFTGDLGFIGSTPLVWEGSLQNWIVAVDGLLALEPETIVPGHGPVTGPEGLREMQRYLQHVVAEGSRFLTDGLEPLEAAQRIDLGGFRDWTDPERLVLNLMRLRLELEAKPPHTRIEPIEAFESMAALAEHWTTT